MTHTSSFKQGIGCPSNKEDPPLSLLCRGASVYVWFEKIEKKKQHKRKRDRPTLHLRRITKLAYHADIFAELNKLNSSMQGRNTHAFQLYDRMEGFVKKIRKWKERAKEGIFSMFPSVDELGDSAVLLPPVTHAILAHLEALHGQFRNYFSEADSWHRDKTWIQFPRLTVTEEDQLIKLYTDSTFRNIYIYKTN